MALLKSKLSFKMMLAIFLLLLALLTVVNIVSTNSLRRLTVLAGQNRVAQEAGVIQSRFSQAERDVLASTKLLASRPGLVEAVVNQDAAAARIATLVGAAPLGLDAIAVTGPDGVYLVTVAEEEHTLDAAQQTSLISLALLGVEATEAIVNPEETALWLGAAVPLRDTSGVIVGALMAIRQVDDAMLAELDFYRQDIHLALVSGEHILAQDFPSPELLGEASAVLLDKDAVERALGGQVLVAENLLNSSTGTPYAVVHAPLAIRGKAVATLGLLYDLGQLSILQRQLTNTITTIFTVVAFVVLSAVAVFIRLSVANPISKLTSVAQKMATGDYAQRVEVRTTDEVGQLGQAFNEMAGELQQTLAGLEQRVADRTRAIETSTAVSRRLSTILDREQLMAEVVKQVRDAFDYYHAHIYLIDEATHDLVMTAGTGEAGRIMLANGHRIPAGTGLTGRAAVTNSVVLASDVTQEEGWLPNPLLPETKSEVAVPIALGERVLGVLDVQHNIVGGLSATDVDMLQAIANQVAIAMQNASLFAQVQQRAEYEARVNVIAQHIQSAPTIEDTLQIAAQELGRALRAQRASVELNPTARSPLVTKKPVALQQEGDER
ncbi:MAG: GAF domain-containing protein [Anaerolineae bacterium]